MPYISSEIKPCHLVLHDHHSRWHQLRTTSTGDARCGYGWPTGATNPVATLKHREVCEALGSRILVMKAQGALILGARPVECRTACVSGTEIRHKMGCLAKLLKSSLLTSPYLGNDPVAAAADAALHCCWLLYGGRHRGVAASVRYTHQTVRCVACEPSLSLGAPLVDGAWLWMELCSK